MASTQYCLLKLDSPHRTLGGILIEHEHNELEFPKLRNQHL